VEVRELPEDLAVLNRLLADPQLPAPIEPAWAQRGRWHGPADRRPPPSGLIPLTCNEVQHLFAVQVAPARRRSRPPAALVGLATPTSSPHPYLPRPTTGPLATMKISDLRLEYQPQHFMVAPCLRSGPANGGGIP
jgi:hypothetical protein